MFISHYDSAFSLLSEAAAAAARNDPIVQRQILTISVSLDLLRKNRLACGPALPPNQLQTPLCRLLTGIIAASSSGFENYKTGKNADGDFESRVDLPDTQDCKIEDITNNYVCRWPDNDEPASILRMHNLTSAITACGDIGIAAVAADASENASRRRETSVIQFPRKTAIKVERSFWKPTERRPKGRAETTLEIESVQ